MTQAILITAYKDLENLYTLVSEFDNHFTIYIHFDKKSEVNKAAVNKITALDNVKLFSRAYKVNWGGVNHLKAALLLSKRALENNSNVYFHLITGEDFPVKNANYFNEFLNTNDKKNYLDYFKLPNPQWANGGLDRLHYYNLFDTFNAKTKFGKLFTVAFKKTQQIFKIKRPLKLDKQLYGGSTYWTLHRDALTYVLQYTEETPYFLNRCKYSFCAEELYFQTILMNSSFADTIVNDDLRYIDWRVTGKPRPAFLEEKDFEDIIQTNDLFARKIVSEKLKNKLRNFIQNTIK